MGINEWVPVIAIGFPILCSIIAAALKLGGLARLVRDIKENELPHIQKRLDKLPCSDHREELVKLVERMGFVCDRWETVERKINGRGNNGDAHRRQP